VDTAQEAYARLIGILYTDGCVSPKAKSWRVIVSNNSAAIVDRFEEAVRACFDKSVRRSVRGKLHVAILDSKEVGQCLVERHGTFRTEGCRVGQGCPFLRGGRKPCSRCEPVQFAGIQYPPAQLPVFGEKTEVSAFLQAAFSCDGGVNLYVARRGRAKWLIRNVYLACKHPNLIEQYSTLLSRLAIKNRLVLQDWRVLIQGQIPLVRFANLIGFFPGSIIGANSPFWSGSSKQAILQLLLESYGNPRSVYDLPVFSSEKLG
jgi:hypothetical protein